MSTKIDIMSSTLETKTAAVVAPKPKTEKKAKKAKKTKKPKTEKKSARSKVDRDQGVLIDKTRVNHWISDAGINAEVTKVETELLDAEPHIVLDKKNPESKGVLTKKKELKELSVPTQTMIASAMAALRVKDAEFDTKAASTETKRAEEKKIGGAIYNRKVDEKLKKAANKVEKLAAAKLAKLAAREKQNAERAALGLAPKVVRVINHGRKETVYQTELLALKANRYRLAKGVGQVTAAVMGLGAAELLDNAAKVAIAAKRKTLGVVSLVDASAAKCPIGSAIFTKRRFWTLQQEKCAQQEVEKKARIAERVAAKKAGTYVKAAKEVKVPAKVVDPHGFRSQIKDICLDIINRNETVAGYIDLKISADLLTFMSRLIIDFITTSLNPCLVGQLSTSSAKTISVDIARLVFTQLLIFSGVRPDEYKFDATIDQMIATAAVYNKKKTAKRLTAEVEKNKKIAADLAEVAARERAAVEIAAKAAEDAIVEKAAREKAAVDLKA